MTGEKKITVLEYGLKNKMDVKFKNVAGLEGAKEEMQELIEFLRNPEKFHKLGAKIPRGVLLVGLPGTGKTLLAKACAGEANVPFFAVSGSEFLELYVGLGAARIRNLFDIAKKKSPSIIFIDEIDAIGKKRSNIRHNSERENTLNQIFVEMDGFRTNNNVIVIAATNRMSTLDAALIRPGRFDRIIEISLPTLKEREEIFGVYIDRLKLSKSHTKEEIAKRMANLTTGMSGAEIMSMCNEAAIHACNFNKDGVELNDFYEGLDRVTRGIKREIPLRSHERKFIAYREAGCAVASWFLKNTQQVLKVSIVPRSKGTLGHTFTMAKEIGLDSKEEIYDALKTLYGGRAAEEIFLGTVTTSSAVDIEKATHLARKYIEIFEIGEGIASTQKEERSKYSSPHMQKVGM